MRERTAIGLTTETPGGLIASMLGKREILPKTPRAGTPDVYGWIGAFIAPHGQKRALRGYLALILAFEQGARHSRRNILGPGTANGRRRDREFRHTVATVRIRRGTVVSINAKRPSAGVTLWAPAMAAIRWPPRGRQANRPLFCIHALPG